MLGKVPRSVVAAARKRGNPPVIGPESPVRARERQVHGVQYAGNRQSYSLTVGRNRPAARAGKAIEMDKKPKETMANSEEDGLKVFVRATPRELTSADLDVVAGGAGPRWIPDG